jgi:hypothetical protein
MSLKRRRFINKYPTPKQLPGESDQAFNNRQTEYRIFFEKHMFSRKYNCELSRSHSELPQPMPSAITINAVTQVQPAPTKDPNTVYEAATAFRNSDPLLNNSQLSPICPPPPLPSSPLTGCCNWSFDENTRVVLGDFSVRGGQSIQLSDKKFLFEMQERDDITLISRGLLDGKKWDSELWDLDYLARTRGEDFFHKVRRFDRKIDEYGFEAFTEMDKLYSIQVQDYLRYIEERASYVQSARLNSLAEPRYFKFKDHLEKDHQFELWTVLYMTDLDLTRMNTIFNDNFLDSFGLPEILPGGANCLLNLVPPSARPIMGPNLYVTPPGSFTYFHQDGLGTVDSGHLCIQGYNEVIILRRLTERHKKHALWILSGYNNDGSYFDGLYSEPHGDNLGKKPKWATNEMINECKRMG